MEPQCRLPGGRMRAEHLFDQKGACECGASLNSVTMEVSELLRPSTPIDHGKLKEAGRMMMRDSMVEASLRRPVQKTKSAAPPTARVPPPLPPAPRPFMKIPPKPKRIGGTTFRELLADIDRQKALLDEAATSLRKVEEWWPESK